MDLIYYIALLKTPSVGPVTFYKLLDFFGEVEHIFTASASDLKSSKLLSQKAIDYIVSFDSALVAKDIAFLESEGASILTFYDAKYPSALRTIYDPPPLLYVYGNTNLLNTESIAIVGSRNPTTTGGKNAHSFAYELTPYLTIVSGMAMGIDACAHRGALEARGATIAVCGTGLDVIYPVKHKHLAESIKEHGVLLSEFPIGTQPHASNFPRRNRIITGLSKGLLMVEGEIKSGSMVSAKLAIEQNKEVFAIPGSIHNPLTSGCHALIKEGAYLTDTPSDILDVLGISTQNTPIKNTKEVKELSQEERKLLKYLDYDGLTIDELVAKSGLGISEINNVIMTLELNGIIEKTIHNTYIKI